MSLSSDRTKSRIACQKRKKEQLGIDPGTAANRLSRKILYYLGDKLDMQWCYHCGAKIDNVKDMSIEHKIPWLHSEDPVGLYFDINNIAFSHKICNYKASRPRPAKPCPSLTAYRKGCRCDGCRAIKKESQKKYNDNKSS
jgi:hypothetical protein